MTNSTDPDETPRYVLFLNALFFIFLIFAQMATIAYIDL